MSLGLKGLIVLRIIRPWITEREEVGVGVGWGGRHTCMHCNMRSLRSSISHKKSNAKFFSSPNVVRILSTMNQKFQTLFTSPR